MRVSPAALFLGLGVASVFACGTFTGAEDEKPAPDAGGVDSGTEAASACPAVVDGPGSCPGVNLANDPKSCGTCGHSCETASCVAGRCTQETVTTEVGFRLVLAGSSLFVGQTQAVMQIDVDQLGPPKLVAQSFFGDLRALSAGADTLYLSTSQQQYVMPLDGSSGPTPNPGLQGLPGTGSWYAAADGTAYYAFAENQKGHVAHLTSGPLARVAEDGAIASVTARGSTAFWVVDAAGGSSKLRGPFDAPKDLATSPVAIGAITDDGDHAYYLDGTEHRLMRVDRSGAAQPIAVEPGGAPTAMTMDGERIVYATVRTEDVVNTFTYVIAVARCGGPPIVLRKLDRDVTVSSLVASNGLVYAATSKGVERLR